MGGRTVDEEARRPLNDAIPNTIPEMKWRKRYPEKGTVQARANNQPCQNRSSFLSLTGSRWLNCSQFATFIRPESERVVAEHVFQRG